MRKFLLFVAGLVAFFFLLANLGPMVILGLSLWVLYLIFKKFMKSDSLLGKFGWGILGLLVVSVVFSNIYAVLGLLAAYALYLIYKNWNKNDDEVVSTVEDDDPFTNFEREWANLNK